MLKMNREFKFRYLMNDVRTYLLKKKGFFDSIEYSYVGSDILIDIKDVDDKTYRVKLYNYEIYDVSIKDFIEKMAEIVLREYEQEYLFQLLGKRGVTYVENR